MATTVGGQRPVFFELLLVVGALYAAWRAGPYIEYMTSPVLIESLWDGADDFLTQPMTIGIAYSDEALRILSIAAPIAVVLRSYSSSALRVLTVPLVILAGLGWYVGDKADEAFAQKAACEARSIFAVCTLDDAPLISFIVFSIFAAALALANVLKLIVTVVGIAENARRSDSATP